MPALLDLLIPPRCVACRSATGVARGDPLCIVCRGALPWLPAVAQRCARCGLPERHGARSCPARRQAFAAAWSAVAYAGPVPPLVLALKDRGALPVATLMAAQLAAAAPPRTWDAATLVPVPPDPWRRRRRGVDHTGAIAGALGARLGVPVAASRARLGAGRALADGAAAGRRRRTDARRAGPAGRGPGGRRAHHRRNASRLRAGAPGRRVQRGPGGRLCPRADLIPGHFHTIGPTTLPTPCLGGTVTKT